VTLASEAIAIGRAAVRAVDPAVGVRKALLPRGAGYSIGGRSLAPGPGGTVVLVAIGKAGGRMADAARAVTGRRTRGIVAVPRGYPRPRLGLPSVVGEHPVPGPGSVRAGAELLTFVRDLAPEDLLLFLLSGGGSATAEVPADPVTGPDLARTTRLLLASGAPIGAMNAIRRHLSAIKGGQLALAAGTRRFATLALSDVVGDPPEEIASGPTVGDPTTFRDALSVARRFRLLDRLPPRVRRRLELGARGRLPETPRPTVPALRSAPFVLVGSNRIALEAAARAASDRGFVPRVRATPVTGETRPAARAFARAVVRARGPRVALLSGGETTVTLGPRPGRGGRNLEFALASARGIRGLEAVVLSLGTDGIDGPTDAAGGWVDGRSLERAERRGIDVERSLARHDSYGTVARIGGLLRTGPTGTNVIDVHIGLRAPGPPARTRGRR
jgi:glycerate 2-kinase